MSVSATPVKSNRLLTGQDRRAIIQRFSAVNRERIRQVEEGLPPRQRVFIELLAFLFHTNHPMMPGFVSKETPSSLADYSPSNKTLASATKLARSFDYRRRIPRQFDIEAIFLIGSAGTIAYTKKSDFDIWLCHRPDLEEKALHNLHAKANKITEWADTLNLEVHFFLMTAEDVRLGRHTALSSESSGSAQSHLLLDEFYRTALHIGGRHPLWWLVPPDKEKEYRTYTEDLLKKRFIRAYDVIDFGELTHIPSNEFFGASLWQLYKAIGGSPFKSVLKILLLEAYASEYPNMDLLSHHYKRAVYEGRTQLVQLDPYILMMEKVERYLQKNQDKERLKLARHSFYFKVQESISASKTRNRSTWAQEWFDDLVRSWGWDDNHLSVMSNSRHWKLEQVLEERSLLINTLMRSYKFLSGFAHERQEFLAISQADMNMLGRRLAVTFDRKAGKLELINRGIVQDLSEPQLYLQRTSTDEHESWLLFRGLTPRPDEKPLRRGRTLVELLAWCYFNEIVSANSQITLDSQEQGLSQRDISAILGALQRQFTRKQISSPPIEELSHPSKPVSATIFINVGTDPFADYTRQGKHLTSNRIDPLNYGGRQQNLALDFDYVFVTNWGEIFTFHYQGMDGLVSLLEQYLRSMPWNGPPTPLTTHCFSPGRGQSIARRIRQLFQDITQYFTQAETTSPGRYILKGESRYYAFNLIEGALEYSRIGNYAELLRYLANPCERYNQVAFDRYALEDSPLPEIFRHYKDNTIQLYYRISGTKAGVYILDEHGSLYHDINPFHNEETLLNQYHRFFDAIRYRESSANVDGGVPLRPATTAYYRLEKRRNSSLMPHPVEPPHSLTSLNYSELKVITETTGDKTQFTVYYDDREFSTLEYGKQLFTQVAGYILQQRCGSGNYPIYITDIDLSGLTSIPKDTLGRVQTSYYLSYKKLIEKRLNEALEKQT